MNKVVFEVTKFLLVSGVVTTLTSGGAVVAATNSHSSVVQTTYDQQLVWVAKDVTQQQGYTVLYKTYDNVTGKLIQTKTVTPPAGSLVKYRQETLAQAKADSLDYLIPSASTTLSEQLNQLHREVYDRLNPQTTYQTSFPISFSNVVQPNTTSTASGSISTGFDSGTVKYTVTYADGANNSVNVSGFSTYQSAGSGTVYQTEIDWNGNSYTWADPAPLVPTSSSTPLTRSIGWAGTSGYPFNDNLVSNSFMGWNYSGYVTLY